MKGNFETLVDMAKEVERIERTKNDYVVPSRDIIMVNDTAFNIGSEYYDINSFAHGQIASKLSIPKNYYDNMSAVEGLRTLNVNAWLRKGAEANDAYYVRTLDGKARAFLSNAYRSIDNYDVLSAFLPVVQQMPVEVKSATLTEKKMYLQIVFPDIEGEVKSGDIVRQGIILTNSEVGAGAVDIKHMLWRLVCSNGMIRESVLRKYHIGSRLSAENSDIYRDDTVKAELDSFKLRMRDVLAHVSSRNFFEKSLAKLQEADADKIIKVNETIQNVTKRFGISEKFNDSILQNMVNDGNLSRYGLANGITFLAHSVEDRDRQYELEKIGAQIIDMSRNEWGKYVAA